MTWAYRIAKKKDEAGDTHYSLVEAYMNDEGEIWGYTPHSDVLCHIQHDKYDDDEQVRDDVLSTLMLVLGDAEKEMIDEDTFVPADTGFGEELEAIKRDNKTS